MIHYHWCWGNFLQVKRDETHQSETWSTLLSGLPNSTSQNPESPLNVRNQEQGWVSAHLVCPGRSKSATSWAVQAPKSTTDFLGKEFTDFGVITWTRLDQQVNHIFFVMIDHPWSTTVWRPRMSDFAKSLRSFCRPHPTYIKPLRDTWDNMQLKLPSPYSCFQRPPLQILQSLYHLRLWKGCPGRLERHVF